MQLQPRVLGNFKFTYTSAGNLHTQVLANAIADLPLHGKYIPLTKNNENIALVISYHKKFAATRGCKLFILMMIFSVKLIWQIFYAIDLQPRVAANSYHKKFAKLHDCYTYDDFFREIDYEFAATRGCKSIA